MSNWKILVLAWFLFQALAGIYRIGRPREPFTHAEAIGLVLECGVIAAIIAWLL